MSCSAFDTSNGSLGLAARSDLIAGSTSSSAKSAGRHEAMTRRTAEQQHDIRVVRYAGTGIACHATRVSIITPVLHPPSTFDTTVPPPCSSHLGPVRTKDGPHR